MPRNKKKKQQRALDDGVLRAAQTALQEAMHMRQKDPARALAQCTSVICTVRGASLHESTNAAICREARSTLCLALRERSVIVRANPGMGDAEEALRDAQAALECTVCNDDAISAQHTYFFALAGANQVDELPAAFGALERLLRAPREPTQLRFMTVLVPDAPAIAHQLKQALAFYTERSILSRIKEGVTLAKDGKREEASATLQAAFQSIAKSALEPQHKGKLVRAVTYDLCCTLNTPHAAAYGEVALQYDPTSPDGHRLHAAALLKAQQPRAACLALLRGAKACPARLEQFKQDLAAANTGVLSHTDVARSLRLQACAVCGASAPKLQRCGRCRIVRYCSAAHQRADWRRHQRVCAAFADMPPNWHDPPTDEEAQTLLEAAFEPSKLVASSHDVVSLQDVPVWDAFTARVPLRDLPSSRMNNLLRRAASFPLTLAAALVAFELDALPAVSIHLVNLDDESRRLFECGAGIARPLRFPGMGLLFCGFSALHGPVSSLPDGHIRLAEAMGGRQRVSVRWQWSLWKATQHAKPPDLVVGFNSDMRDVAYEWPATLAELAARNIPCVFTASSERAYEHTLAAVRAAKASPAFHGAAPFRSPYALCRHGELAHDNAFWVSFRGGPECQDGGKGKGAALTRADTEEVQ